MSTNGNTNGAPAEPPPTPGGDTGLTPASAQARVEVALTVREWSEPWMQRFLAAFAQTLNVSGASRYAGVSRETAYRHRRLDAVFAESWLEAREIGVELREQVADRWATTGEPRTVTRTTVKRAIVDGALVTVEEVTVTETSVEKSPQLLMFLLGAHKPEKYRTRHEVRHRVPGDGGPEEPATNEVWRQPTRERMLELAALAVQIEVPAVIDGTATVDVEPGDDS